MSNGGDPCAFCGRYPCACAAMGIRRHYFEPSEPPGMVFDPETIRKAVTRPRDADAICKRLAEGCGDYGPIEYYPMGGMLGCALCGETLSGGAAAKEKDFVHAADCPWLRARQYAAEGK